MSIPSPIYTLAIVVLRVAVVIALFGAGWNIYRRLPGDDFALLGSARQPYATELRIVRRTEPDGDAPQGDDAAVKLYPIDVAAAQREYNSERRAGLRFEEFLRQRMGRQQPRTGHLDARGEATINVPPGRWWVHAKLSGAQQEMTWRLPINVAGRERTVELNAENAYTRAKSF